MKKAIFLDRDGTINKLIFNHELNEHEPPHHPDDFEILDGAVEAMKSFNNNGYLLFVISNQPDFAKGKTTLENIRAVHAEFEKQIANHGIKISGYFYCYHHPNGIVKEYSLECECRKPKPYFANKSITEFEVDRSSSWFIGDRVSDVMCGKLAGLNTVFLTGGQEKLMQDSGADLKANGLLDAAERILEHNMKTICHQ